MAKEFFCNFRFPLYLLGFDSVWRWLFLCGQSHVMCTRRVPREASLRIRSLAVHPAVLPHG